MQGRTWSQLIRGQDALANDSYHTECGGVNGESLKKEAILVDGDPTVMRDAQPMMTHKNNADRPSSPAFISVRSDVEVFVHDYTFCLRPLHRKSESCKL